MADHGVFCARFKNFVKDINTIAETDMQGYQEMVARAHVTKLEAACF